jgi:lactaldehyde dehydrogenase/glycolaldehyde dehydrogenase
MQDRTNNTYKLYINAEHVDSSSHKTIDVRDPASEEVFTSVSLGSAEDARRAIAAAKAAQKKWAGLPAIERSGYLTKLAQKLRAHSETLGRVITGEQGKPISVATGCFKLMPFGI